MGTTIVIILLVPLMFQVFISRHEQKRRHEEIMHRLAEMESKINR